MFVVHSYPLAVVFCVVTMFCWGSWATTKKLARPDWRFELFYWDYALGVPILTLILGLTLGSSGTEGRPFLADLAQASSASLGSALLGGAIFNLANILLVAAIEIAGMAVAFPVGIGLALVIGVVVNHLAAPVGNVALLAAGVMLVTVAIRDFLRTRPGSHDDRGILGRVHLAGISHGASRHRDFARRDVRELSRRTRADRSRANMTDVRTTHVTLPADHPGAPPGNIAPALDKC